MYKYTSNVPRGMKRLAGSHELKAPRPYLCLSWYSHPNVINLL